MRWSRAFRTVGAVAVLAISGATASTAAAATPWPGGKWEPGPAQYGMAVQNDVRIPLADGVTLSANIGYPTDLTTGERAAGRFPVLVRMTPYTDDLIPLFVQHGYIDVNVRTRGTGLSGGSPASLSVAGEESTQQDGAAIMAFAKALPGSNGTLGMYGCSGEGGNIMSTSVALPQDSGLKAVVPACKGFGYQYRETFFASGIPTQSIAILSHLPQTPPDIAQFNAEVFAGGPIAYAGDPYWDAVDRSQVPQALVGKGIATLLWTNWADMQVQGSLYLYSALQNVSSHRPAFLPMRPGQPASSRYQIIVGTPTGHGQGLDFGIMLEWFDTWLQHDRTTTMERTRTPMHEYEQGSDRWINQAQYPATPRYQAYYLNRGNRLSPARPRRTGSESLDFTAAANPNGSVTYTTRPFARGASLSGPIDVSAYASSSGRNLTLIGTLSDVAPDGTTADISRGTVQGSMRKLDPLLTWYSDRGAVIRPFETDLADDYLQPGATYRMNIGLLPRVWSVEPGHALRLTISTQSTPAVCAAALGNDPCAYTQPQQATLPGTYTIHRGPWTPSAIELPLLPYRAFATAAGGPTPTSTVPQPLDWGTDHGRWGGD